MKKNLIISLVLLTAGCANTYSADQYVFVHPSFNEAQFQKDKNHCMYEAVKATPPNYYGGLFQEVQMRQRATELVLLCMSSLGYTRQLKPNAIPDHMRTPQ